MRWKNPAAAAIDVTVTTEERTMRTKFTTGISLLGLLMSLPLLAQAPAEKPEELPMVIVHGYATPQMWKISKDGHVMWLLAIGEPAPAGVPWRSDQLEARVAESQLVLYADEFIGVRFKESNHWGYALPPDQIFVASPRLTDLRLLVDKAAKKYKVKVRTMPDVWRIVELSKAEAEMLHTKNPLDPRGVPCHGWRLNYLEYLIKDGVQQANAAMQAAVQAEGPPGSCLSDWLTGGKSPDPALARSTVEKVSLQWKLGWQQMDAEWMAAAQAALKKNKSTFTVQWTLYFSHVKGYVAQFRELGYEVEEPGSIKGEE